MEITINTPAIVGEIVAGQGAKIRKQLQSLIKHLDTTMFDVMDLLHEVKSKKYYQPKYNTFGEYLADLKLKPSRAYYFISIKDAMLAAGIPREQYEPVGTAKLRIISRLDTTTQLEKIKELVTTATNSPVEEIAVQVAQAKGETGKDARVWLNVSVKLAQRDVIEQAVTLAQKEIGSVGQDGEGNYKDASTGRALELICADYIAGAPQEG